MASAQQYAQDAASAKVEEAIEAWLPGVIHSVLAETRVRNRN